MSRIVFDRVAYAYAGQAPLFDSASFTLERGLFGVVGENGAGKSTLLALAAGARAPDEGTVRREPRALRVAVVPQDVAGEEDASAAPPGGRAARAAGATRRASPSAEVAAFGTRSDGHAAELRARLALAAGDLARWSTLSPGQRKRWQLGAALVDDPDAVLLDEPTNHLDDAARAFLVRALRELVLDAGRFGLVVSHDRALLDAVTRATLRVQGGRVELWPGPYGRARDAWEHALASRIEAREDARREASRLRAAADGAAREARAAQHARSTRVRSRGKHDADARSILARNAADWASRAHAGASRRLVTAAERVERDAPELGDLPRGGEIAFRFARAPRPVLAFRPAGPVCVAPIEDDAAGDGGRAALFEAPALTVARGTRAALVGPNGAGKSTLLADLAARAADDVVHLPQDLAPTERLDVLERVRAHPPDLRGRVLGLAATLGLDPGRLLRSRAPSPGEARKLVVADALGRGVAGLFLDEPEGHLDLPSVERLTRALASYPGALVIVSHDRELIRGLVREVWEVRPGNLYVSPAAS